MAARSLSRWQKAGALVPMALLVAAWGAAVSTGGLATASSSDDVAVPDVPQSALDQPASVEDAPGIDARGGADSAVSSLSPNGIPAAALYAYRRAETLLARADESCNLPWTLLAAIGRVESNHGRTNGNSLTADGLATPGIYGVALDGRDGRMRITDTDDGKLDRDPVLDRAVGPMQFIPSTWSSVGVDADADGKKNPQDIDDAATAAGVYLCAGPGDLSERSGAATAVRRYNNSSSYVDLVLQIAERYAAGEFTEAPDGYTVAPSFTNRSVDQTLSPQQRQDSADKEKESNKPDPDDGDGEDTGGTDGGGTGGTGGTGGGGNTGGGNGGSGGSGGGTLGGAVQDLGDGLGLGDVTAPITGLLSRTEATLQCTLRFPLGPKSKFDACMDSFGF